VSADSSAAFDKSQAHRLLVEMLRIRRFEEKCAELYSLGKIRGFLHLYIGEEAIAVGAMQMLGKEDRIVATYRDHGHALARGIPSESLMAEMYGKVTGCSRGHGGSMHIFDAHRRFYGGYAIVAGGLPIAVGLALADKLQGKPHVTACFFGEGAVAEGEFHESLNLARLWNLPVLFLCENNLYAMGTALDLSESQTDIHLKAQSYNISSEVVDGMDVLAVMAAVQRAVAAIRTGGGPYFLELKTYRFRAHSMADPELYRNRKEVEQWKSQDPISLFISALKAREWLSDAELGATEKSAQDEMAKAVRFAEESPLEAVADLILNVYTPCQS